ncbi:MAG TPA: flavodoxin-dependent (E)-4-hydroxy-3-methylbut-2-enyl-diphosphate synthase [Candidatus Limnocylindrales bacterium]|nr:flavodoxin-dependent (E)-4-hydroxy-3-methylbut-2-enyl-diphosphate synthase [Candidatus Limnocylindrales bacterium]
MKPRRKCQPVRVGDVVVGGAAPIVVQSMCKSDTRDVKATLDEIARLKDVDCKIVRVAVPTREAAEAMIEIKRSSPLPIIADIHYDYPLALAALDAGVDGLRLNPGNIRDPEKVKEITRKAKEREVPIRIGVNAGSLPGRAKEGEGHRPPMQEVVDAMVSAALGHIRILEALDFNQIKVSMKASDPPTMIAANRALADKIYYPLHLGVTESGPPRTGSVKSAVGIGVLLEEGIGDTIRVSLAGDSVEEVEVAYGIINALSEKQTGPNLIACPMCGRLEIDMLPMVAEVEKALKRIKRPINVSVMGCVVNGPGEGQHADIGIAGGKNKGILFKHGKIVGTYPEKELVPALLRELDAIAAEDAKLAS